MATGPTEQRDSSTAEAMERRPRARLTRGLAVGLKLVAASAVLFFVVRALARRFSAVSWAELEVKPVPVALAVGCLAAGTFLAAVAYRRLLASLGRGLSYPATFAAVWVATLAKYVPGKVTGLAGAAWMFRQRGVPAPEALSVVAVVQGLSVVLGLVVAAPLAFWQPVVRRLPVAWLWCGVLVAAAAVCVHPRVFRAIMNRLLRALKRQELQAFPAVGDYVPPVAILLANQVLAGTALWLVARSLGPVSPAWLPFFISASALAITAGLLAIFAPAGLGVREGILLIVLGPVIGGGLAAVAVACLRVLQTLVDAAMAAAGAALLRSVRKREACGG